MNCKIQRGISAFLISSVRPCIEKSEGHFHKEVTMEAENINRILIIGGGSMGQQIATQFALMGCHVVIYDISEDVLEKALVRIRRIAPGVAAYQGIPEADVRTVMERITTTTIPEDAAVGIDLVSESIPEDPVLKGKIFALFHTLCPPQAIFTTNASTLLPSMIAPATGRPEKFIALHFHDIRISTVVDIMPHDGTSLDTIALVKAFADRMGLVSIVLKRESPGYVFNYMLMAWFRAAQTIAARGIAPPEDVDRAWMGVTGNPVGPFGMMDSIGLDTIWKVTAYWADITQERELLENAAFLKSYVDRGTLGQKTGRGIYTYPKPIFTQAGFVSGRIPKNTDE